jgi:hypothetical protein
MAVYESLLLNTAVPQIQAAQAGDSYVMVVNATTPALRITQTGTGNAISVEDEANPDATPFVVSAAGDVGIGTNAPAAKLEVFNSAVNGAFVPNTLSTWRVAQIRNDQSVTSGSAAGIAFVGKSDTQPAGIVAINGNTTGGVVGLGFLTVAGNTTSESMRLDSPGNLGLGVTPSAWTSSFRTLQFGAIGSLAWNGSDEVLFANNYASIGGSPTYITSAAAMLYRQSSGAHAWFTAPSGTAGNAISFTQVLTLDGIDGSGYGKNLKLGGTADRATTKGTHHFDIFDGTAPVGTLANGISFYSAAGEAYVMDAAGNATLISPHDSETNEWIFRSKHTPTGKVLRIDVERLLRFVNDHFGLDAVKEFVEE